MRFYLQRKSSWFNDNFLCVADEDHKQLYDLKATIMLTKTIRILDGDKNEVAVAKQELKSLLPKYSVYVDGEKRLSVKKLFNPIIPKYELEGEGWEFRMERSDLLRGQYNICRNSRVIATVTRGDDPFRPSRVIDMADCTADDRMVALALVVAMEYGINFEDMQTVDEKSKKD